MADGTHSGTDTGDVESLKLDVQQSTLEDSAEAIAIRRQRGHLLDGINLLDPHSYIKRERLVQKTVDLAREAGIVVVSSPPGTGKSSLMQLITRKIGASDGDDAITGTILRPSRPNKQGFDLYDWVRKKTGVCYEEKTIDATMQSNSEVWLLFDDAQRLYGEKFHDFWQDVVKTRGTAPFSGGTRVHVVISATYYLTNEDTSPVALRSQPRIEVEDLLLSQDEARELFSLRFVYPKWETYQSSLFHLTNGNAAAFAIGMNIIGAKTLSVDFKAEGSITEEESVKELHEGTKFLESLERCFPVERIDTKSHELIVEALVQAYRVDIEGYTRSSLDDDPVIKLKKAGILMGNNRFASTAAACFYYQLVFPRASSSAERPESVDELIEQAASRLSARRLRVARQRDAKGVLQTPRAAVFQQLFHESIASLLPSSYRILPEYGTEATINGELKTGELDFYILNGMKWGLELLRDGDGIGKDLRRITGIYQNVEADEWLILDCRMHTGRRPHPAVDRCSLVFAQDFRTCQCYMRLSEKPKTINLME